jgi:hypothetical protein
MTAGVFRRREDMKDDERPGRPVMMKIDVNVEKMRTHENRTSYRHRNDSGGVEYGKRNGETNVNNRFEHEKNVCQNSPEESTSFNRKTNTNAQNAPYSPYLATCGYFIFPKLKSSLE